MKGREFQCRLRSQHIYKASSCSSSAGATQASSCICGMRFIQFACTCTKLDRIYTASQRCLWFEYLLLARLCTWSTCTQSISATSCLTFALFWLLEAFPHSIWIVSAQAGLAHELTACVLPTCMMTHQPLEIGVALAGSLHVNKSALHSMLLTYKQYCCSCRTTCSCVCSSTGCCICIRQCRCVWVQAYLETGMMAPVIVCLTG